MKNILKYIMFYIMFVTIGAVLFAISFRTPLFKGMTVYYYRALLLLFTTSFTMTIILILIRKKINYIEIDFKDVSISLISMVSLLLVFVSVCTVSMDRSISVFILADMATNNKKVYTSHEIEQRFLDIYMDKYDGMERRFDEQLLSGNIIKKENGYQISKGGERLISIFRFISKVFPVDDRFLYPPKI